MILLAKDIVEEIIVQSENNEEKSEVKDLLIEKNRPNLAYLTFEIEKPADQRMAGEESDRVAGHIGAGGGQNPAAWNATPGTSIPKAAPSVKAVKQTFLIPRENIERITANAVMMKGTEIEEERLEQETLSFLSLKNCEVETSDGEKLGKIKDLVIEEKEQKVIGLKLSEGFWEKLTGDGTKYMPYEGLLEWEDRKMIVEPFMKDRLADQLEDLL